MMKHDDYVNSSYLNHYAALVAKHNGDVDHLLDAANINHQLLESSDRLIPLSNYVYLLELSARVLEAPYFAMELARKQDINFLGPLSIMLYRALRVVDAIETISRYFKLTVSGVNVQITTVADTVSLKFQCDIPYVASSMQYQDYVLASTANVIWKLVGRKFPFRGCYFTCTHEESQTRLDFYTAYFGCPIAFSEDYLTLTADKKLLDQPLLKHDPMLPLSIELDAQRADNLRLKTHQLIRFFLSSGLADSTHIAQKLGYSRRTFQRELHRESTSFKEILEDVRRDQAKGYLLDTRYRLTEISLLLGYKNLGSFTRSFKRWYGFEPSKARDMLLRETA
jgi:AraC-like DNA-binding protein